MYNNFLANATFFNFFFLFLFLSLSSVHGFTCCRVFRYFCKSEIEIIFREYTLELYQMASKVTRDEATACLDLVTLGSLLSPLYFTIDQYRMNADVVILGEDMHSYAKFAEQVCWFELSG